MAAAGFRFRKIKSQPLLGQKLLRARKKMGADLEQVEAEIKVRAKYLRALEEGDYRALPTNVYVKGFLQNYTKYLGLDFVEIYDLYLKEGKVCGMNTENQLSISSNKVNERAIVITPRSLIWPSIALVVILIVGYVFYQVTGFASAPKLLIASPAKDLVVTQNNILFEGSTDVGAALTINGQVVTVAEDGHFKEQISLQNGLNTVEVTAKNKSKRETKKICIVEVKAQTALK